MLKSKSFLPGMDWWIDVAEIPLIRRNLTIWLHVPFTSEEIKLFLGEGGIHNSQWNAVKGGIPSRKERIFPPM